MAVDEGRADQFARSVNYLSGGSDDAGGHGGDPVAVDGDIGLGAIGPDPTLDQKFIAHPGKISGRGGTFSSNWRSATM